MDNRKYFVYFGSQPHEEFPDFRLPAILFSPLINKWEDPSFRTRFVYKVIEENSNQHFTGEVQLAFLEAEPTELGQSQTTWVNQLLGGEQGLVLSADELPIYFTMHQDMKAYREVVGWRGPEEAENMLLAMNDLVAVKRLPRPPPWLAEATRSRQFRLEFMHQSETFFAFHNAGSILGGLEQESLKGISERLRLEFKLPAFDGPHVIEYEFEHESDLPKRIAIMIGENGVGKSQALAHFTKSLLAGDEKLRDGNGQPPRINRLLAVSGPGETRYTFPGPRKKSRIIYNRIYLSKNWLGDRQSSLGSALVRLARSTEAIKGKNRWDMFCEAASVIAPLNEVVVRVQKQTISTGQPAALIDEFYSLAEMRKGGEKQRLERWADIDSVADVFRHVNGEVFPLSSGQLTFIRFTAQACLHIENGTMVLVDEPETHLHPRYITDFVRLLDRLLAETGSFAILATHSAYFVREVARSQVIVLREVNPGRINVVTPRLRTFGADIGEISHFVFGDRLFGKLVEQVRDRLKRSPNEAARYLKSLEGELSAEAWMNLSREIPTGNN